jgi:hypothetical protein
VLTALVIIGGIIDVIVAVFSSAYAAVSLSFFGILAGLGPVGILLWLVTAGCLIAAVVSFMLAYGLWKGRSWAWTWTFVFSIIGLIVSIIGIAVGIGIIGVVIYAVIIYYLTRSRVKAFFGKGPVTTVPARAFEPSAAQLRETAPTIRPMIPGWKAGKFKVLGLIILALLLGSVLGYSFRGSSLQQATVHVTVTTSMVQTVTAETAYTPTSTSYAGQYDITIRYTEKTVNKIEYSEAGQGLTFLVVTVEIQNHADKEFSTNPYNFNVIVNNVKYNHHFATYSLPDSLKAVDLLKDGTASGSLVFEVPSGTTAYTLTYEALFRNVEIEWIHY